jgi:mono/diheme cytochrome c family protein
VTRLRTGLAVLLLAVPGPDTPADSPETSPAKGANPQAAAADYARHIRPFLDKHCIDCHGEDTAKAGLRLDSLAAEFAGVEKARLWTKVLDRLEAGDMPPKKRPRPPQADRDQVSGWINDHLLEADRRAQPPPGSVMLRRLTRLQYENAIHDLLAIDVPLQERLPEDKRALGFDNVGEALNLSPEQLEVYLESADVALDAAVIKQSRPETWKRRFGPLEVIGSGSESEPVLDLEDAAVLFSKATFGPAIYRHVKDDGLYRFRLSAYAYQSKGDGVEIYVRSHNFRSGGQGVVGYFEASPDTPKVIEFVCRMAGGTHVNFAAHKLPYAPRTRNIKEHPGTGIAVQWLEVEGPLIDTWPPASHRHLFGDLPLRPVSPKSQVFSVVSEQPRADAERLLRVFMRRAYRRPVTADELAPIVKLVTDQLDAKQSFEEAMRVGTKAILCSPDFLFFPEKRAVTDDLALAARLSYFLWNTQPDEELAKLAEQGVLSRPEKLRAQVERLLNHPRARGFIKNFVAQWLDLRQIDFTMPDRKLYPEFDDALRRSMVEETELFFDEVLKRDLSLVNFVDSDFSILNERLALHYGIASVKGPGMRRVALPAGSHRGGVLTQASVLKVTANGTSTSPVTRGGWVLRNILGKPPDPPPPNAGAIEPDIRGAKTIREQLDKHRRAASCASCHVKIDPLGFALENFDVTGAWRDKYRVLSGPNLAMTPNGPLVEADSSLADGRSFRNIDELKKLLIEDKDQLARCLTEKLLIYGTGRNLRFSDRAVVKEIVARSRGKDYGLRSLIHEIVQSRTFLNKGP